MSNNQPNQQPQPQQQPPTKEQEGITAFNNALALIQASGTTLNNVVKSLQEGANAMMVALREKDAELVKANARIKELEGVASKDLKAEPKKSELKK